MTKARTNADNVAGDISGVTAGTGLTGGGTSGTVTLTNDMATTIAAAGDLIYGTGNDAYSALSIGTAGKVLKVNSGATAPEWAVDPTTDVVTTAGDLIYGTGADAVTRLGIGTANQVLKVNSTATAPEWGTSGYTWTYRGNTGGNKLYGIATNGSNIYVGVCASGALYSSTDSGVTWTSRTSAFGSNAIYTVDYGNGIFVAGGASGVVSTSTDGINWTARTANLSTNQIQAVRYLNGTFIIVADGGNGGTGGIATSTDGITWTKRTTPSSSPSRLTDVAYGNGYYVAVGDFNIAGGLYSTNLSTWTALPASFSAGASFIAYNNNQFLALQRNSINMFSTGNNPTSTWTYYSGGSSFYAASIGSSDSLRHTIFIYDNNFYGKSTSTSYPPSLYVASTNLDSTYGMIKPSVPIPLPVRQSSQTSFRDLDAILITSDGKIIFAIDGGSSIYTSF